MSSVELAGDVEPLGVGVDSELDRGVDFSRIGFGGCLHRFSAWGFHPRLTTPCHLAVVYPGRPEWTEVYDLKNDPFELQNLPADGPLGMSLQAELEKQMTAVGFKPSGK